jgi:hypothetical protein
MLPKIRLLLALVLIAFVLSGLSTLPLQSEIEWVAKVRGLDNVSSTGASNGFDKWIVIIRDGLRDSYPKYPWLGYGTDWLGFAQFVLAIMFIGPIRDPVKNIWVIEAGMIACVLVVPYAFAVGSVRGIPVGWRLIDCSFGVLGFIVLRWCRRLIKRLSCS